MNYSFEEMLKYDMFKSVEEVKEFWNKSELIAISKDEHDQIERDAGLISDAVEAMGKIKQITDDFYF